MNKIKKILIWSLIAVLLQNGVYFAADKYYQKTVLNTKVTEVRVDKQKEPPKNLTINIPLDAKQTEVSYDGKYISYYEQDKLNVINSYNGTKHVVSSQKGFTQVYCKWFPDIDSMVICEKSLNKSRNINIYRYNADNDSKFIPTSSDGKNIKLKLNNSNDNISDIAISSTMNLWYVKILKSNGRVDIFNIDVNGNVLQTFTSKKIGQIGVFRRMAYLIYEDKINNTVEIKNKKWNVNNKKICLLNTDESDNLYVGILQDNRVTKILYGSINKTIEQWKSIELEEFVDKKHITITSGGKIYVDDGLAGNITEKLTNKKTKYEGNLLAITDKTLITVKNGLLIKQNMN